MARKTITKSERNKVIIENALYLIENQGIASFKFSALGRLSNCSNSTIYDLFKSKEDVIVAIINYKLTNMYSFNCKLIESKSSDAKLKLYILLLQEIFSGSYKNDKYSIHDYFSIYQFIYDHADSYLNSETYKLITKIKEQSEFIISEAIENGSLFMLRTDMETDGFDINPIISHRNIAAVDINKFKKMIDGEFNNDSVFLETSKKIETLPWLNKNMPSLEMIKSTTQKIAMEVSLNQ